MSPVDPNRREEQHRVVKAFITACTAGLVFPFALLVAALLTGGLSATVYNIVFVVGVVSVVALLIRWFVMYRTYKAGRTADPGK